MIIAVLVVVGLIMGSFVNAFVWRTHEQQVRYEKKARSKKSQQKAIDGKDLSITTGRSMCFHCGHELSVADLVPVLSYLWLRGKCRYCGQPIDDTPLAELLTPALFVMSYVFWPFGLEPSLQFPGTALFCFWLAFLVGFVILALYDIRWYLLPDTVVFPLIGLAVIEIVVEAVMTGSGQIVMNALFGVAVIAGLFEILYLFSRGRWIGFGDVKLAFVLGLLAGDALHAVLVIFVASLLGSFVAVPLLVRGHATAKTRLPFGPYLLLATVIVVLFGDAIIGWYGHLLGVG